MHIRLQVYYSVSGRPVMRQFQCIASISIRVQKWDVYSHLDIEFWTYACC